MTLEEAIRHCEEVAGDLTEQADTADDAMILDGFDVDDCRECAADHRQFAEWLKELKALRSTLELCKKCQYVSECPINYPWLKED